MRIERDQLGQLELDKELYGIHTLRSYKNFIQDDSRTHTSLIKAMVQVKLACALGNHRAGLLSKEKLQWIKESCHEILNNFDPYRQYFVTHPLQGGAGTSTNMNVNEVITNLALNLAGFDAGDYQTLHPINDTNMSQSTNDVYPTALKIAAIYKVRQLADELADLQESLQKKETEFSSILKLGRTQLMDALPITLGQEFGAYARAISRDRWRIYKVEERLREVNIGGTAVGTGMNAPLLYIYSVTEELQKLTGLGISRSDLIMYFNQQLNDVIEVALLMKVLA